MATMTLALGTKSVTIIDMSIDDDATWSRLMQELMLPMLAAHGYMIQNLYEAEDLKGAYSC